MDSRIEITEDQIRVTSGEMVTVCKRDWLGVAEQIALLHGIIGESKDRIRELERSNARLQSAIEDAEARLSRVASERDKYREIVEGLIAWRDSRYQSHAELMTIIREAKAEKAVPECDVAREIELGKRICD